MFEKLGFRNTTDKLHALIDYGFRHAANGVPLGKMRELVHFNDVRNDPRIFNRHLVRQPGHGRAIRSGRSNKDLDVKVLI